MKRSEFPSGHVLAGKYRVERELGRGGMGVVLGARHVELGTRVAVKVLRHGVTGESDATRRFLREARAAARIESDHVVRVFDVGTLEDGQPYMAMEHLDGCDGGKLLAERGRLPIGEAVGYLLQAIDAIAEAHAVGVVHRDLKPSNLFFTTRRDGSVNVKVMDFGVCKIIDLPSRQLSSSGPAFVGTPQYMSPEQLRAAPDVDALTDIWALGVILHRFVGGELPFRGETFPELCAAVLGTVAVELSKSMPGVPSGFSAVVRRCLARDRKDRYPSVSALREALLPFAPAPTPRATKAPERELPRAERVVREPADTLTTVTQAPESREGLSEERRPSRMTWSALLALGIALSSIVAFTASGERGRSTQSTALASVGTLQGRAPVTTATDTLVSPPERLESASPTSLPAFVASSSVESGPPLKRDLAPRVVMGNAPVATSRAPRPVVSTAARVSSPSAGAAAIGAGGTSALSRRAALGGRL